VDPLPLLQARRFAGPDESVDALAAAAPVLEGRTGCVESRVSRAVATRCAAGLSRQGVQTPQVTAAEPCAPQGSKFAAAPVIEWPTKDIQLGGLRLAEPLEIAEEGGEVLEPLDVNLDVDAAMPPPPTEAWEQCSGLYAGGFDRPRVLAF
jgi:hypothetical protein